MYIFDMRYFMWDIIVIKFEDSVFPGCKLLMSLNVQLRLEYLTVAAVNYNFSNFRCQQQTIWLAINVSSTSSPAVPEKPRDASCLSVVSFNSTKLRAQSFIVSYVGYRFITAYN